VIAFSCRGCQGTGGTANNYGHAPDCPYGGLANHPHVVYIRATNFPSCDRCRDLEQQLARERAARIQAEKRVWALERQGKRR